ncbi:hypothetical protein AOXY_G31154 [Acipenser oxyrinchus oxyrinchus]|uniref:GRP-10 n=1 Tax=Acipenser oxyrinchus oxyrinchus TaxID=40147 RepID=A0AAD8FPP3_ACIOX|nr:hypothetical protein AOXY_G31154 [Acipenser oxyrinchus oxyrinchus]
MDLRRLLVGWTLPLVVALLPVYSGRPARTLSLVGARSLPRGHHWAVGHFLGKKSLAAGPMESLYRLINPSTHRELETARPSASHRMRLIVRGIRDRQPETEAQTTQVFVCLLRRVERRAVERCLELLAGKRLLCGPSVALRD